MHVTLVLCMHEHVIGLSMLARGLNRYTCMFLGCHVHVHVHVHVHIHIHVHVHCVFQCK